MSLCWAFLVCFRVEINFIFTDNVNNIKKSKTTTIQNYLNIFYIHWVTLLCTMGDNPYKYYNLQWEIIHTLLSCDNIFFVHVLYVFSIVLFCLLMIVQCLDFKSIKLLLLLLLYALIPGLLSLSSWSNQGRWKGHAGLVLQQTGYPSV